MTQIQDAIKFSNRPKIRLGDNYDKYNRFVGKQYTTTIDGKELSGVVWPEHPNFDPGLVRNEHYYGEIIYWLYLDPEEN